MFSLCGERIGEAVRTDVHKSLSVYCAEANIW
jgi:hypothetical protein